MENAVLKQLDELPLQPQFLIEAFGFLDSALKGIVGGVPEDARVELTLLWVQPRKPLSKFSPRFVPVSYAGDAEDAADALWRKLTLQQWAWIENRASQTPNPALKAHYSDILWETKRHHRFAKPVRFAEAAAAGYLAWLDGATSTSDCWSDVNIVSRRLAELGLSLGRPLWVQSAFDRVLATLLRFESEGGEKPGLTAKLSETGLDIASEVRSKRLELNLTGLKGLSEVLERFRMLHSHPLAGHLRRRAEELLGRLDALEGRPDQVGRRRAVADSLREQGEFHMQHGNALVAASFLMEAVDAYTSLGDQVTAAEVKRRAREAHAAALEQMTPHVMEFSVPNQVIENVIGPLIEPKSWDGIFERSSQSVDLVPDLSAPLKREQEGVLLSDLATNISLSGDRQIARDAGGAASERARNGHFLVKTATLLFWLPLLGRASELGLSPEGAADALVRRGVVPERHSAAVRQGILRFFEGDWISAVHILTPQFEAALRGQLARLGLDVTAYRTVEGGRFQERPITVYFNDEENAELARKTQSAIGLRLWAWLRFVFVDERGLNIRNRIAHGLMPDEEIDGVVAGLVLLGFVRLVALGPSVESGVRPVAPETARSNSPDEEF